MSKYTLFISDLHLDASQPEKAELLFNLLTTTALKADALYILGDFFEAWIGDDDNSSFNKKIVAALKTFSANKIPLYFIRGNRDFLISKKFAAQTDCTILSDPAKIDLYGKPTLLTHGDLLCTKDTKYLAYRKLARNQLTNKLFLLLPLKLRKYIANKLRNKSIKAKTTKTTITKDIDKNTVNELMQQYQTTQLIHGHTHLPGINEIKTNEIIGRRITLGAWDKEANALIYYADHTVNQRR
ncbi:MAG: UDP-2,3-diacylglucosamine diphosphatase [Gammaproteobacteria bacterium]|nr:UDP-2,3-diacylglucosamine diphosphatase [Gammaproteobacteria bacterium]